MLVTVEDFRASRYGRPEYTDDQILSALAYAESRFYTLTDRGENGYWLEPRTLTVEVDGSGTSLLRLPYPVCGAVKRLVFIRDDGSEEEVQVSFRARSHFLYLGRGVFPEGFSNVRVTAEFGDPMLAGQPIPEDVKEAIRRLAHMKLRRHRLIAGEEIEEHRPPTEAPPPPTLTGDREVDGIIRTYMIKPPLHFLDLRGPVEEE